LKIGPLATIGDLWTNVFDLNVLFGPPYTSRDPYHDILATRLLCQAFRCSIATVKSNKKAQLSLTNPRDAKACQNCSNSTCLQRCR